MELSSAIVASLKNPDIGDLALSDAGTEIAITTLAAEVAQRLHVRFNFLRGEWFLDQDEGAPYYGVLFVKSPSDRVIRAVFQGIIAGTEGVVELTKFEYSVSTQRRLSLTFTARLEDGTKFSSNDYGPYVVAV